MNLLDKLERKFGRFAIPNLIYYIIAIYASGTILYFVAPEIYATYLSLNAKAILEGQVWRVVTFLLAPVSTNILFAAIVLMLYYFLGIHLERYWGSFRFNLYFIIGAVMQIVAALLIYLIFGQIYPLGITYLNQSLFLAFVVLFPHIEFRLFFVIPIKAKWLGMLQGLYLLATVVVGIISFFVPTIALRLGLPFTISDSIAVILSFTNFLIFYFAMRQRRSPKQHYHRSKKLKNETAKVIAFQGGLRQNRHICHTCQRTDVTHPELEFRFCSKCEGNYEYCEDHLYTHTHIKKGRGISNEKN